MGYLMMFIMLIAYLIKGGQELLFLAALFCIAGAIESKK